MARCLICAHPDRVAIEDALVADGFTAELGIDEWRLELHLAHTPALLRRLREGLAEEVDR